ncbi:MAG: hypothetical protein PVJ63_06130 [Thioalkalispiraceae bacterium]|jgi:hypothetical protein
MSEKVELHNSLVQKRLWHGENRLTLREQRTLKIQKTGKIKTSSYMIDIIALDSHSRRVYSMAWPWLAAASVFFVVAFVIFQFPGLLAGLEPVYAAILAAVMAVCAVACFIVFWLSSSRKQVFYTLQGHIPLVEIWVSQPSRKIFRQYVKSLTEQIQQVQEKAGLSKEQQLTGEMKMLRRLADENILNKEVYEEAKASLFKKF